MLRDTMGLSTDMAPNFPVPSPYLQMTLPQPTHLSVPGIKGQWGSPAFDVFCLWPHLYWVPAEEEARSSNLGLDCVCNSSTAEV